MSCQECMYISGHSDTCSVGTREAAWDLEWQMKELKEKIARLVERIESLEEWKRAHEQQHEQAGYSEAMKGF